MTWSIIQYCPRKFYEKFREENPEFFEDDNDE